MPPGRPWPQLERKLEDQSMYSGLIIGHALVIVGFVLATWNLTGWYKKLMAAAQGSAPSRKPSLIDGIGLISGMLLVAGGACCIVHWIIDYRLLPACR